MVMVSASQAEHTAASRDGCNYSWTAWSWDVCGGGRVAFAPRMDGIQVSVHYQ